MSPLPKRLLLVLAVAILPVTAGCDRRGVSRGPLHHPAGPSTAQAQPAPVKSSAQQPPAASPKPAAAAATRPSPAPPEPPAPPTTPQESAPRRTPPAARQRPPLDIGPLKVPLDQLPPPGQCRVWVPGRPASGQPATGPCAELRHELPAGAWLVHRPASQPGLVRVSVSGDHRSGLVVAVRLYDAATGRFLREELP